MHAAIRSTFIGAVTLVGAGAVAVGPIASTPPDLPRHQAITLAALSEKSMPTELLNPAEVFAPIRQRALVDQMEWLRAEGADPFPIARALLANQIEYGLALTRARLEATQLLDKVEIRLAAGDPVGAFEAVQEGTVLLQEGTDPVAAVRAEIRKARMETAMRVAKVLPEAVARVGAATWYAMEQTMAAQVRALQAVGEAAKTGNLVQLANAVTLGGAQVATVIQDTVFSYEPPQGFEWEEAVGLTAADAGRSTEYARVSVRQEIANGRRQLASAISRTEIVKSWPIEKLEPRFPPLDSPEYSDDLGFAVAAAPAAASRLTSDSTAAARKAVAKRADNGTSKRKSAAAAK